MAYTDQAALAADAEFVQRVAVAVATAAVNLYGDPGSSYTMKLYCNRVLTSPTGYAAQFAWGVVADATITAESSDAVIFSRVAGVFPAYAGA
jgi:hypothetical protein